FPYRSLSILATARTAPIRRTSLRRSNAGMIPQSGNRFSDKIMPKQATDHSDAPHLPRSAPIDAYGNGGFAFADMSHRGSLLCLPDAIWAWPIEKPEQIDRTSLERV